MAISLGQIRGAELSRPRQHFLSCRFRSGTPSQDPTQKPDVWQPGRGGSRDMKGSSVDSVELAEPVAYACICSLPRWLNNHIAECKQTNVGKVVVEVCGRDRRRSRGLRSGLMHDVHRLHTLRAWLPVRDHREPLLLDLSQPTTASSANLFPAPHSLLLTPSYVLSCYDVTRAGRAVTAASPPCVIPPASNAVEARRSPRRAAVRCCAMR